MLFNPLNPSLLTRTGDIDDYPDNNGTGVRLNSPDNGAYGSYIEVIDGANVPHDCYGIYLNFNTIGTRASNPILVTIGIDPAGGTSYVDTILDLSAAQASGYLYDIGGHNYYFPLFIPAGSSIAAKTAAGGTTSGYYISCVMELFGGPSCPEAHKVGQKVISYGATVSTRMGITASLANSTVGAWVELGTVGADENPFFWDLSVAITSGTLPQSSFIAELGIGDASDKTVVVQGKRVLTFTSEAVSAVNFAPMAQYYQAAPGDKVYGRLIGPTSGTWSGTFSLIAHGVQ